MIYTTSKKIILFASIAFSVFALSGCGGNSTTTNSTEATKADVLAVIAPKTASIASLPPAPESQAVKSSISGVDANANGVRDDIEISLAKTTLHDGSTTSSSDFARLLDVIKSIQPSETAKTIDVKKFYCAYQAMPASIKEKVTAGMLIALVTDTPARKKAYAEQSINTSGSLGVENCE